MFTAYERSAFGELAGGFWIPLLLLFILRDRNPQSSLLRRAFDGSSVLLALVVAGAWLCNAPLGVMASYLLASVALAVAAIRHSWAPILRAIAGVTLGIGFSALYLVPAAMEQRWVQIRQAVDDPGLAIRTVFFSASWHRNLELHDVELLRVSIIAVIMLGITFLAVFLAWRRGKLPDDRALWIPLALIPVVILFLQFSISLPIWNALPKLRFLQFPWRWLVALSRRWRYFSPPRFGLREMDTQRGGCILPVAVCRDYRCFSCLRSIKLRCGRSCLGHALRV